VSGKSQGVGGVLLLAAVTGLASVADSALLVLIPLAAMLVALTPRHGLWVVVGIAGGLGLLWGPVPDAMASFSRGWSLVLAGWFVVACVAIRRPGFLPRGLTAVAATTLTAALFFAMNPGSFGALDQRVQHLFEEVSQVLLSRGPEPPPPAAAQIMERGAALQAMLYPAGLAIGSLAGLAVAWWLHGRIAAKQQQTLGRLREFRFADGLIWLLIAGLILMVAPLDGVAERAGSNLLLFMGALYALRGLAVASVLAGSLGPYAMAVVMAIAAVVYPVAILLGVTDTWLDLRTRRETLPPSGR
jgi:hypothetical protein